MKQEEKNHHSFKRNYCTIAKSIDVHQLKTIKNKTKNNNKWRPNPPTPIPSCLTGYEGGDKKTKISKLGMVQKCLLGSRLVPSYAVTIPNEELL